jgi:hypothetical protein
VKQKKFLLATIGAGALITFLILHRPPAAPEAGPGTTAPAAPESAGSIPAAPLPDSTAPVAPATQKAEVALANFSEWAVNFTNGTVSVVDGQRLAWKRREAMLELIQTDPRRALEMSVPFELRQQLPREITRFFEEQVDGRGGLEVLAATDFSSGSTVVSRRVQIGERRFDAFVYGRRKGQISQSNIPLHGVALDNQLALATEPLRLLSEAEAAALDKNAVKPEAICSVSGDSASSRGRKTYAEGGGQVIHFCGVDHVALANRQLSLAESGGTSAGSNPVFPSADLASWTHGRKSVLYIRVNFPDDLTEPVSEPAAYAAMNGVNAFYTENSYNLTALTATVTPVITMPQTKAYYSADPGLLQSDAWVYAKRAGFATQNYDRDIIALTSVPGYDWGGLASVGGKGVWLQSYGVGVTSHELGHNYGLFHANFWNTLTNFSMIGPGTNLEYGNIYDTMGPAAAGNALFNAVHKNLLDWLKADAVQTITSSGVYRIYPFDVPAERRVAGRFYGAALKKDSLRDYWLEFRTKYAANPWLQSGLLLNWTPWGDSNGGTQLVDTTPGSPDATDADSRSDAAVTIGRTFSDAVAGVHITPLRRGLAGTDPWIDFQVIFGAFPNNQPPVLAVEAEQTNAAPGSVVHFHATATDPDGDPLVYAWWFDDLTFSTNNLPWAAKFFSTPGDHLVRCVVSDLKGGVASANVVVNTGASPGVRLSGRVTDTDGNPLEGVLVGNGQIPTNKFVGGWTDSDGRYVLVNVNTQSNLNLQAFQFGHTFSNVNWSTPFQPTNTMSSLDIVGFPLPRVTVFADTNSIAEIDGTIHTFTLMRTGSTNSDLAVNILQSGSATPGGDYTLSPDLSFTNSITIPAGTNRVTFALHIINDSIVEGPETVTLTLLDDSRNMDQPTYALAPLAEAVVTIVDDDAPAKPVVTVTTSTPAIAEGGMDDGQLIFTRNGVTTGSLIVNYSVSGTATPGVDYFALPGVVVIPAGQSSTTIPVTMQDDKNLEPDETVVATITANAAYTVGSPVTAAITILDDDFMTVSVYATGDAAEPATAGKFTLKRDGDLTAALVVNYGVSGTASNGVDYAALNGSVTIPAGAASTEIAVTPIDDLLAEGDETVTLTLFNTVSYDVGTPGTATVMIRDNEKATVSISTANSPVSEQGASTAQFIIARTGSAGELTVNLGISGTATSGADYVPLDNPVVIPDGSSSVMIEVIPFHDLIFEPTETVILTLPPNTNYNVGAAASATVEIEDDGTSEIPGVGFCFAGSAISENSSPGIAVTLSQTSNVPVKVGYRVIGGTTPTNRYSLPQGVLTIPASNWVGFVPLQIVNDTIVQPPQTIRVALFNPTNATLDGIKIHTYTILDDDACSVSVAATAPNGGENGPVAGNFRITRVGPTNGSQLVNFQITGSASAPTDYAPLGNSATIPAGAVSVDLPVVPGDDNTMEFTQTVVLTLTSATNANIISPNVATVTIADNDTNTLPVVTVTSTNHPFAYEGGGNGEFLFTRSGATTNALTILFAVSGTANNGTDYALITNGVTIPVGQGSAVVAVVPVDDALVEGDETVIVSLTQGTNHRTAYPAFARVTIQDNDQRAWVDASDFRASKYAPRMADPGEFTFSRFGTTNTPVTIFYRISGTASNGLDYVRITNSILIPAGQLATTLPIFPLHNGLVKGPATAILTLLTNAAYTLATPTNGTVIIDDDMPALTISAVVPNVLEGSGSNGVFRVTRSGDPKYDFTGNLAFGGMATFGVDYPPFATNIYFSCGVTSVDLFITPTNEVVVEGDESVTARILPSPAYSVLSPSNAVLTIADAGLNATPAVIITSPKNYAAFVNRTNAGLLLNATVIDDNTNLVLTWTNLAGPAAPVFGDPTTNNTTVRFTTNGIYQLRLTADDGQLQGHADLLVFVSDAVLNATNLLHWSLDDGTGTNVNDSSGTGRDGIFSGQPTWTTNGVIAGALKFSGTNDSVRQSAGENTLNGLKAFTVALWIKAPPTNTSQGFVTADDAGTNDTFSFTTRTIASCGNFTNVIEATIPASHGTVHRASASRALKPGEWQHLALTWTNGTAPKLYVNGSLDQPGAGFTPAAGVLTNCPQFIIGKGAWDSPAAWSGALDDVRVFDVVLSAEEILALAEAPVANHAPVVEAGPDVVVQLGVPVTLTGMVTDDGLPNPPASVTNWWTYLGTNNLSITNPASLTQTFAFDTPGTYVFRLIAYDGDQFSFDDVTIIVLEPTLVSIYASRGDAYELGPQPGEFTLTRIGDTNEMSVALTITGSASNRVDYLELTNFVVFAQGADTITFPLTPLLDDRIEGDESVILTLQTNIAYSVSGGPASVTIHDSPYGLWSIQNFTLEELTFPNLSGAGADFDHDGVKNFAEYAFNRDPRSPDSTPPYLWGFETSTNDNRQHLTFTYTRRLPPRDVQYGVYVSTNMLNWSSDTNVVEEFLQANDPNGITETVKVRALAPFPGGTNLFMHIRVWLEQVPAP